MRLFPYRKAIPYLLFWPAVTLAYSLIFTTLEFSGNPIAGLRGLLTIVSQWMVVALATAGVTGLLSLNRLIFAATFPILVAASTVLAYFTATMGVTLTPMCIELIAVNETRTNLEVVSPQLVAITIMAVAVAVAIVIVRWRYVSIKHPAIYLIFNLLIVLTPFHIATRFSAPVKARMPYSFYFAISDYLSNRQIIAENRTTFDHTPVSVADNSPDDVVIILGESLRADHLSINGYHRPTTPLLEKDTAVVSIPRMHTMHYYTHVSVPHIMTRADSINPDRAYDEQSLITIFKRAGYHTAWISNQDAVNSYVYFMHEADTLIVNSATKSIYNFGKWLDSDLLPLFDENMRRHRLQKNLTVIHTIGSHWWYRSHYPDSLARFTPEIDSRVISELTDSQITNSYDNTIIATDRFIADIISRLRDRNAIVIYISDHGESLGENGNYLHAADAPRLHNPACLVWYSPAYAATHPGKVKSLKENSQSRFTTDVIFHSAIDGAAIATPAADSLQSIFSQQLSGKKRP